jgi:hypothetical protein
MSDTDENDQNDDVDLEISDEDAERLLSDAVEDDVDDANGSGDSRDQRRSDRDDPTQRELTKWKSLARKHEREAKQRASKLKEYEDANKSEAERLSESATEFRTRAEKAESALRRREIAEERAPAHATLAQIKAVAKRLSGDDDEALEADADELFAMFAQAPPKEKEAPPKTAGRPRERLRPGNTDPEEDEEEVDPRKLADAIRRNR